MPIALWEDVSVLATALYAIATDIVSVLPIAIKGVELVIYGSQRRYAFNAGMYYMNQIEHPSIAETWVAECEMKPFVRQKGIGLLAVAAISMVPGIVLEVAARRLVKKRKQEHRARSAAIFEQEALLRRLPTHLG